MSIQLLLIFAYDFLTDCPSYMHGIAIHYVLHCQAMLECGVCELAESLFLSFLWSLGKNVENEKNVLQSII